MNTMILFATSGDKTKVLLKESQGMFHCFTRDSEKSFSESDLMGDFAHPYGIHLAEIKKVNVEPIGEGSSTSGTVQRVIAVLFDDKTDEAKLNKMGIHLITREQFLSEGSSKFDDLASMFCKTVFGLSENSNDKSVNTEKSGVKKMSLG